MTAMTTQPFIIVLAHLMEKDGSLGEETIQRITHAIKVDQRLNSRALVLCGWDYRKDSNMQIAEAMRRHIELSYPGTLPKVFKQALSRDTVGDAFYSRVLLEDVIKAQEPDLVVVTSGYHVQRTNRVFRFIFHGYANSIRVEGCRLSDKSLADNMHEIDSTLAFNKTFLGIINGDMDTIHNAMATGHPFYNGSVHQRIDSIESAVKALRRQNGIP